MAEWRFGRVALVASGVAVTAVAGCGSGASAPRADAAPPAAPSTPPAAAPLAPSRAPGAAASAPAARPADLNELGGPWEGTLTYKDYTSGKATTIKVRASGVVSGRTATLRRSYPDEPGHESADDYSLSDDGRTVGGLAVVERSAPAGGPVRLVLEERGKDGNDDKPATFHHVIVLGPGSLTISKLVRFDGESAFFERNAYALRRPAGAPAAR